MTARHAPLRLIAQLFAVLSVACCFLPDASGQAPRHVAIEDVRVCPANNGDTAPPDYSAAECRSVPIQELDPQGTHIWARLRLPLGTENLRGDGPFGLMVMGKMSSEIYVNEHLVGTNGQPGDDRRSETPGRIDASLFVPHTLVRTGDNTIDIRMSSHYGWLELASPVHAVQFGRYQNPTRIIITGYWPSLITFGVFLVGLVFFGVTTWRNEDRSTSALLAAAALFAGTELLVETARGLVAYPYPFHDVRLVLITLCAAGFGICVFAYLLERMTSLGWQSRLVRVLAVLIVLVPVVIIMPGFDGKTVGVLTTCALAGLAWSALWAFQRKPGALGLAAAFTLFLLVLYQVGSYFLDVGYFYAAAGVLAFAMYQQAQSLVAERRQRRLEARRALKLETALDQARQKSAPAQIQLVSAGRVDYVSTDRIVQLKAAGDYVELHFEDGRTTLYTGTLGGLENELPPAFLRVHRSHVVNTLFVSALERDAGGTGELILSNGARVPVSRRILPTVRSALAEKRPPQ